MTNRQEQPAQASGRRVGGVDRQPHTGLIFLNFFNTLDSKDLSILVFVLVAVAVVVSCE